MPDKEKEELYEVNLNMLKESAGTSAVITESILGHLIAGIGGYLVGRKLGMKIVGHKSDVEQLKQSIIGLKRSLDDIRRR